MKSQCIIASATAAISCFETSHTNFKFNIHLREIKCCFLSKIGTPRMRSEKKTNFIFLFSIGNFFSCSSTRCTDCGIHSCVHKMCLILCKNATWRMTDSIESPMLWFNLHFKCRKTTCWSPLFCHLYALSAQEFTFFLLRCFLSSDAIQFQSCALESEFWSFLSIKSERFFFLCWVKLLDLFRLNSLTVG